ncbi:dihydropteroate synthase [Marinovum sp.]|uniref:dihydropteroate synthase n=1 Tax=Marinovum sp. TaxID=2024839 RepID=UPI002B266EE3|nr:dihydropteroate synthase [Marinovum sp.]
MTQSPETYFRPLVQRGPARPEGAVPLAGGAGWFTQAERLSRSGSGGICPASEIPADLLHRLSAPRAEIAGLAMDRVRLMGILNVTPDSFSDGGQHDGFDRALAHGRAMAEAGADILDIGGESTRPGATDVPDGTEIARTAPVIAALSKAVTLPISIDTRKRAVAEAAAEAGAHLVNDVSGLTFDPGLAAFCAEAALPVCIMHSQGTPQDMQDDPRYDDVLLEVYDFLAGQIAQAEAAGIARSRIVADPGIGFGKTTAHNLALLRGLSLFHGLGVPLLLGASRKGLIRDVGRAPPAADRMPGSVAVALAGVAQGVQILRIHDVVETRQALRLWLAIEEGNY